MSPTLPHSQTGMLSAGKTATKLQQFHAGGVVGLTISPLAHTAVTAGHDGR